ncbi:methyl coenzyme M reductase subunit gamma [Rothia mucilaginosa]|uniref:methyl coenzyme M reductase subunit gamma n=1 Tax=Rothia mucilaginosa TaxID=43675 RepID=UPI0028D8AC8F|nr:methyl coenzyme M reductase subunit gamma [Rothia mucilaginosa]
MKPLKNRTGLATLSATLMLALSACGGSQTTSKPSASASTMKASASASVVVDPKGSEVIEIRAADDTNADAAIAKEAAIKAAKRVVAQDNRMLNAWLHGDLEHTSDEELLKFVAQDKLDQMKTPIQSVRNDIKNNGGAFTGNVTIRDVNVTDIFTYDYPDGTSYPYSVLRVKFCEDWTQLRTPDGERAVTGPDSTATVEVSVLRLQDGRYVYNGSRELGTGCAS